MLLLVIFQKSGGINLARVGPLPTLIVAIVFGVVFFSLGIIIIFAKVSEIGLRNYSIIFWIILMLQQYATYSIQIHLTASNSVLNTLVYVYIYFTYFYFQIDSTIFVVFITYFIIPLSLRIATGLSVTLTLIHLLVSTTVAHDTPGEILVRQVCQSVHLFCRLVDISAIFNVLSPCRSTHQDITSIANTWHVLGLWTLVLQYGCYTILFAKSLRDYVAFIKLMSS